MSGALDPTLPLVGRHRRPSAAVLSREETPTLRVGYGEAPGWGWCGDLPMNPHRNPSPQGGGEQTEFAACPDSISYECGFRFPHRTSQRLESSSVAGLRLIQLAAAQTATDLSFCSVTRTISRFSVASPRAKVTFLIS